MRKELKDLQGCLREQEENNEALLANGDYTHEVSKMNEKEIKELLKKIRETKPKTTCPNKEAIEYLEFVLCENKPLIE